MKRIAPIGCADSALVDVLTAPAGHKYEVLELFALGSGTTGTSYAWYYHPPAGYFFAAVQLAMPAADWLRRDSFQALVLEPGDKLTFFGAHTPAAFATVYGTYIDVTL